MQLERLLRVMPYSTPVSEPASQLLTCCKLNKKSLIEGLCRILNSIQACGRPQNCSRRCFLHCPTAPLSQSRLHTYLFLAKRHRLPHTCHTGCFAHFLVTQRLSCHDAALEAALCTCPAIALVSALAARARLLVTTYNQTQHSPGTRLRSYFPCCIVTKSVAYRNVACIEI